MTSDPAPELTPPPSVAVPSPAVGPDRRAHRRARLDLPVLVETEDRSATTRSVDLGAGGISVRTSLPLTEGERVSVYLELPIGVAVETQAEVVRRQDDVVALRFVDAPREAVIAVRSFCRISSPSIPAITTVPE